MKRAAPFPFSVISPEKWKRLAVAAATFWLPFSLFAKLADEVREQEAIRADSFFLRWLHSFASPALDRVALLVTDTGSVFFVCAVAVTLCAVLFYRKRRRDGLMLLVTVCGAGIIDLLLKLTFHRQRPALWSPIRLETDYSFPSGHAMLSSSLAFSVVLLLWPTRWRWLAVTVAAVYVILIGLSRLYLGVHFPSDVIAGWCASALWVGIAKAALLRVSRSRRRFRTGAVSVSGNGRLSGERR
jgi:undecaprenyl-diphosphatase